MKKTVYTVWDDDEDREARGTLEELDEYFHGYTMIGEGVIEVRWDSDESDTYWQYRIVDVEIVEED